MALKLVGPGRSVPRSFNVIIEIPAHSDPIKYEVDKLRSRISSPLVDRPKTFTFEVWAFFCINVCTCSACHIAKRLFLEAIIHI